MLSINKILGAVVLGLGLLAMAFPAATAGGPPREKLNINPVWRFTLGDPADASKADFDDRKWDTVSLPHSHLSRQGGFTSLRMCSDHR